MNLIVGPFVVTQTKYTPFCDSNHTEFCCIKMLLHGTTQRCNVETMLQQFETMLHRCVKNRRGESSCVKTPLIFFSSPSLKKLLFKQ